jgi:hypothetical protein
MAQVLEGIVSLKNSIRHPIDFSQDDTNTSCSAGDPLDVTRSIIDRDIARLEESIRALKSRRNELSPISRLPVEILCSIFSLIEDESILFLSQSPESWTNFSRVSQHWRSSALSAPELWTNIPLSYPLWTREMLIRSKMAKLTIRSGHSFDTSNPKAIETVRLCLYEMNRVEEIKITFIPGSILEEIFRDLPKSAPQLHTLCIGSCSLGFSGTAFSIHEDFLYNTECLQRVELISCKISWDSRFLTGLTRLTLEDSLQANSSIIQVLHALQRMPALTDLHLTDSIPDDSDGLSTYPVVDLPYLRKLRISSGVGALTTVLRHITFPHSAILNLTCKENQSTQIDFSNFLSVLATKFLSSLVIRSLNLHVSDDIQNSLEFYLWTTAIIQDCFPSPLIYAQSQLQLTLTWPSPQLRNHEKVLTCAFDAISLPFLTQLRISTLTFIDSQTWVNTFGKLPILERVCVQGYATHSILQSLVYKAKAAKKSKSKTPYCNVRVPFPKLRYIHLEGTDFYGAIAGSLSIDVLLDYLMERCDRDAEVQVLRLDDCYYISSEDVEKLKEVVVDVIWDGVEQECQEITDYDSEDEREYYDDDENTIDDLDYDYDDFSISGGSY